MLKIYTLANCPYCLAAKQFLNDRQQQFEEINIEKHNITREKLTELTGGHTVPQIVIDGKSIGGFDNLMALDQAGQLPF